jgi:hypothetical protein
MERSVVTDRPRARTVLDGIEDRPGASQGTTTRFTRERVPHRARRLGLNAQLSRQRAGAEIRDRVKGRGTDRCREVKAPSYAP